MPTPAHSIRIAKAIMVFKISNEGASIVSACAQVGISRSSFYYLVNRCPEVFADLSERLAETAKVQLMEILFTRVDLLQKLLADGLAEDTTPRERLAIFMECEKHLEKMMQLMRIGEGNNEAVDDVLGGPVFTPGTSRYVIEETK